jgi:hypothetical protein
MKRIILMLPPGRSEATVWQRGRNRERGEP